MVTEPPPTGSGPDRRRRSRFRTAGLGPVPPASEPLDPDKPTWRRILMRVGLIVGGASLLSVVGVVAATLILLSAISWEGCTVTGVGVGRNPGQGTESLRLPVDVAPRTGLTDGQAVLVTSTAFAPHSIVGVATCLREADVDAEGVDACDTVQGSYFAVDPGGRLAVAYTPPRVITVGGTAHDCAAEPDRCLVVAADFEDYDRSGGQAISFALGLGPADLTPVGPRPKSVRLPILASPPGPAAPGSSLEVTAVGFVPGEPVLVAECTVEFLTRDAWEVCGGDRAGVAISIFMTGDVSAVTDHADGQGAYTTTVTVPDRVTPTLGTAPTTCALPESCGIVIAAAADFTRSAFLPLTLEP